MAERQNQKFAKDVSEWVRKSGIRGDKVLRKLALDGFRGVTQRSPVLTGRFRGNWRVQVGSSPDTSHTDPKGEPPAKSAGTSTGQVPTSQEMNEAQQQIEKAKLGDTIWVTNNLPYAIKLEDGHSKKSPGPNAVLGQTFNALVASMGRIVQQVKRENP